MYIPGRVTTAGFLFDRHTPAPFNSIAQVPGCRVLRKYYFAGMLLHSSIPAGFAGRRQLVLLIRQGVVGFAGNRRLKIYGSLSCASGKRMKIANRVFFTNEHEATTKGYRPCAHCLYKNYQLWRENK